MELPGTKVAVIGGTAGIGQAIARRFAQLGADVIVVGRSLREPAQSSLRFIQADLSRMSQAQELGRVLPDDLDVAVFTVGVFPAAQRETTADGIERDLAISYLSRLVATRNLAPRLSAARTSTAEPARIFIVGFPGGGQRADLNDLNSEREYKAMRAHSFTVAGNEALVVDAANRYEGVEWFGVSPGLIRTGIREVAFHGKWRWLYRVVEGLIGVLTPSADQYAAKIIPHFVSPELAGHSGAMIDRRGRIINSKRLIGTEEAEAVIAASDGLLEQYVPEL